MRLRKTPLLSFGLWLKGSKSKSNSPVGSGRPDSLCTAAARFAAFALAICSRKVAEDLAGEAIGVSGEPSVCGIARLAVDVLVDAEEAGLVVAGLAEVVTGFGAGFVPGLASLVVVVGFEAEDGFTFETEGGGRMEARLVAWRGTEGFPPRTEALNEGVVVALSEGRGTDALTARRPGVGFETPIDMRLLGCAMVVTGRFAGEGSLGAGLPKPPSPAPGLLGTLIAEAGRDGGPIGLTIGLSPLKNPDLLRSVAGVAGSCERLSTVRSDSDGREAFRGFGVASSMNGEDTSGSGSGLCSRCPIREAVRKLSSDPSWSLTSSCSG